MSASTRRESLSDPANDILLMKRIFSDIAFTALLLAAATGLSFCFFHFGNKNPANITVIYILALILIALKTNGYLYGIATALFCVVAAISLITSATTTTLKRQRLAIAEREKKLAEADREKLRANLLRAVSHDLRTPLTSIIGSSSSYLENYRCLTDADRLELVSNIKEDSEWLLNMVENLLTVTRINDSADNKVKKSSEVVEEVVSEAIQRLQKRLPDIRIRVSMPSDFLMLPMDPTLIEQVLINLIENAVIHSGSTEPVDLTICEAEDIVSFTVRDYGKGIDRALLPHIFEGQQLSSESEADGRRGMGIGLSICRTIIQAHGGTIRAENLETGAEFTFTLPKEKEN